MKSLLPVFFAFALGCSFASAAEVIEVGATEFDELPGGKEADGIVGDFVMRNDLVEVVISGNLPLRRPNMGGFYGTNGETPGIIYDLTLRGADNDQMTLFSPSSQKGPVSYVRPIDTGDDSVAAIETVVTAARGGGLARRHVYRLRDGEQGILIESTISNQSDRDIPVKIGDVWTQMREKGSLKGIQWANAIDPADRCGYAVARVETEAATIPEESTPTLKPGETVTVARFLAVGTSPAEAMGVVAAYRNSKAVGTLRLSLRDESGAAIPAGQVDLVVGNGIPIPAYPDEDGKIEIFASVSTYTLTARDIGREAISREVELAAGDEHEWEAEMSDLSTVVFSITDESGGDLPIKVQFNPRRGTADPNLGPTDRAHGCVDQWHSETGSFTVPLPPGDYRVIVTRGPEFDHLSEDISLKLGKSVTIEGQLIRSVDTRGWVSTDFHNHSTPSGDNTCGTDDRIINLAVEHIEFAPTTEHNRLYDWEPHIDRLDLGKFLSTVPGMELTGRGAHFNCFPLVPDPTKQDGGAPVWQKDPRLNTIVLRNFQREEPDRWVHLNHPDMSENFVDWNRDGRPDGGYPFFANLLDGLESQNYRASNILAGAPYKISPLKDGIGKRVEVFREVVWLQLLNRGVTVWGIGVADAHHVHGNGVGSWRTYIPSSTDSPSRIDWREMSRHAKAGRMILTSGPFLEVETGSGAIAGGQDRSSGEVELDVKVQCPSWLDIDRVQVLVNGYQHPDYNYTRETHADMFSDEVVKFDHTLSIDLSEDAHLIVVAIGENSNLQLGYGSSTQSSIQPCAYNNPIFIDVDGGGFQPNYDELGHPLPVSNLSVEKVEALLAN
ncbi:MAG: CehA/McbA family metallohydrolase [Verrucomicrobiota bacterium]